ncbi:MAG TPA: hypothetical protein VI299_06455, partial [Polyangiales bacterium]
MATVVSHPHATPRREAGPLPNRPSGIMPVFRGAVSLPPPVKLPPPAKLPLQLARAAQDDDAEWAALIAAAKEREDEAREWEAAIARSKALIAAQEEREWARLRM